MRLGLEDKVVFVAGASRGIGKGVASVFLDEGARVTLTGRDSATLTAAGAELSEGRPDRVMTFAGDLTQAPVVEEARRRVTARWGAVDSLVCNIGSGAAKNGWQLTAADWEPCSRSICGPPCGWLRSFCPRWWKRNAETSS